MFTWVIVTVTAVVAVGVLILLVVREPVNRPRAGSAVDGPQHVRRGFRMVWPGYDPAEVDAHLEAVEQAWSSGRDRSGAATSERSERDDRGGGRDRSGAATSERDRLREELEEGGGDGAGALDR